MKHHQLCPLFLCCVLAWMPGAISQNPLKKVETMEDEGNNLDQEAADLVAAEKEELEQMQQEDKDNEEDESREAAERAVQASSEKPRSPYALGFTFRSHKSIRKHSLPRFSATRDNQMNFLLIEDSQKYCEGSSILLATDAATPGLTSLQAAEQSCMATPSCTFFSFSGHETRNDANPGATWLCSGEEWLTTAPHLNWVTAVRPDYIQASAPNYDVSINSQAICDGNNLVGKAMGPTSPLSAASACDNDARCSYFVINFGSASSIPLMPRIQSVYYCNGAPINKVYANGWIVASRRSSTAREINPDTGLPTGKVIIIKPATGGGGKGDVYHSGSITQDDYYDSQKKGVIVPPINLAHIVA